MKVIDLFLTGYDDKGAFAVLVFDDMSSQCITPESQEEWTEAFRQSLKCPDKFVARHFADNEVKEDNNAGTR